MSHQRTSLEFWFLATASVTCIASLIGLEVAAQNGNQSAQNIMDAIRDWRNPPEEIQELACDSARRKALRGETGFAEVHYGTRHKTCRVTITAG